MSDPINPLERLPRPCSFPTYLLPVYSRTLTEAEQAQFTDLARRGLYSPLQLGEAFRISRGLAFALYFYSINPSAASVRLKKKRIEHDARIANAAIRVTK